MTAPPIRIGSRGSALALAQAGLVQAALDAAGHQTAIVVIETAGDRRAPDTAWGEGAFVAAIERALLDDRVDVAVHSAKDVPTDEDPRLRIAAYLPRADPRDALVAPAGSPVRGLSQLPAGARVGTDSPRRTGFLRAHRPDLAVKPLHGNVDTRLRRLDGGDVDALVLACAGLDRLGRSDRITERLGPELIPPAPGQGAIAVQIRAGDRRLAVLAGSIDDPRTRSAVEAERAFLAASGGGCRAPIGALATVSGRTIELLGGRVEPDGSGAQLQRLSGPVDNATEVGRRLAERMADGPGDADRRVLVTRPADQATELIRALRDEGLEPVLVPAIEIVPAADPELAGAASRLGTYRWVVVTSANGARAILTALGDAHGEGATTAWAAVGPATTAVLAAAGIAASFQPSTPTADRLADELPLHPNDHVLVIRGDLADGGLAAILRARGARVDDVVAYRTVEAPATSLGPLRVAIDAGPPAGIVLTSGSTARGLAALAARAGVDLATIPAVCIGDETAGIARATGFRVAAVAARPTAADLARATARCVMPQLQEAR